MDLILRLDGITKQFSRRTVLDNVGLHVGPGERIAVLGDNGSGKTTMLRIAAGLSRPQTGQVEVLGIDMLRRPEKAKRMLGYIPQKVSFPEPLTTLEILNFFARIRSVNGDRIDAVITELGLEHFLDKLPGQLSGGMMQRLALAVTMLDEPKLLLLDEPTAGLDQQRTMDLHKLLIQASFEGTAVLLATHLQHDVGGFAHRTVFIADGRMTVEELERRST